MSHFQSSQGSSRYAIAGGQEHEARALVDVLRKEFPHWDRNQLEAVYARARESAGPDANFTQILEDARGYLQGFRRWSG